MKLISVFLIPVFLIIFYNTSLVFAQTECIPDLKVEGQGDCDDSATEPIEDLKIRTKPAKPAPAPPTPGPADVAQVPGKTPVKQRTPPVKYSAPVVRAAEGARCDKNVGCEVDDLACTFTAQQDNPGYFCGYEAKNLGEWCTPGVTSCPQGSLCSQIKQGFYCLDEYNLKFLPQQDVEGGVRAPALTVWKEVDGKIVGINYNPELGDRTGQEFSASDVCIYSQQDEEGLGCGSGLLINNTCQYDERVSQPLTKANDSSCTYTSICYTKDEDICKVGICKGGDCKAGSIGDKDCKVDEPGLGQPIGCEVAKNTLVKNGPPPSYNPDDPTNGTCIGIERNRCYVGKFNDKGQCIISTQELNGTCDPNNAKTTSTCVYSHPEDAKDRPGKCFVGRCIGDPDDPDYDVSCTQGSFNIGCRFQGGIEQEVSCPTDTSLEDTGKVYLYAKVNSIVQPYRKTIEDKFFISNQGQPKKTLALFSVKNLFDMSPQLTSSDPINFCVHFPAKYVIQDACTDITYTYQKPD